MRNKKLYIILFALLLIFLFMPMIQEHLTPFRLKPLDGVTISTEFPELTLESFSNNKYQTQLEKYVSENFGFREFVIRLYNQYVWSFFRKTYSNFQVVGKDNWTFYTVAVNDYYGTGQKYYFKSSKDAKAKYDKNVRMMCKLRNVLKTYDTEFMTFMAPSKPYVYPEFLPNGKTDSTSINARIYYDKALTEAGFPNIDMTKWFISMRDTLPYPLFGNMDMHWQFTSIYAYDSLLRYMNQLNDFGIPEIKYSEPIVNHKFVADDEGTLNLLFPVRNKTTNYKLEVSVDSTVNKNKPKVLFVGDSFIWAFGHLMPWKDILADNEVWYYNSGVYKDFIRINTKKDNPIYIIKSLLKFDYVIFYTSAHQWNKATMNFVEDALLSICVSDSLLKEESQRIAQENNISIDSATKMIKKDPELVKGLDSDSTPTIRNEEDILLAKSIVEIENDRRWLELLKICGLSMGISLEEALYIEAKNIADKKSLLCDSIELYDDFLFKVEKKELISSWLKNPEMMSFIKNKAIEKNKPLDTVIEEDAIWVLKQKDRKDIDFEKTKEKLLFEVQVNELVEQWRLNPEMMYFIENKAREIGKDIEKLMYDDARWVLNEEAKKKNMSNEKSE